MEFLNYYIKSYRSELLRTGKEAVLYQWMEGNAKTMEEISKYNFQIWNVYRLAY
jgi:hypothetical protein